MSLHVKGCRCTIDRRRVTAGALAFVAASLAPRNALARATPHAARPEDETYMRLALQEAAKGDFPFGAVIVKDGKLQAAGRNSGLKNNDPTAHGEIVAIRNFTATHPAAELKGATIYTTDEPCPMCMAAIVWSGFGRVVYAASIAQLSTRIGQIMLSSRSVADAASFAEVEITGGVLAEEALALFPKASQTR
jgi:guanine deaminase